MNSNDELAVPEMEVEESGTSWTESARAVLRGGWWLGKKVAIAGAAITTAPVVIPPLIIFSAIGVTLSLPFGVYYASYAGTEKVMRSLLPLPLTYTQYEGEFGDEEAEDEIDPGSHRTPMEMETNEICTDGEGEEEMGRDVIFNSEEGSRDSVSEDEIQLSYHPSLAMEDSMHSSITIADKSEDIVESVEDEQEVRIEEGIVMIEDLSFGVDTKDGGTIDAEEENFSAGNQGNGRANMVTEEKLEMLVETRGGPEEREKRMIDYGATGSPITYPTVPVVCESEIGPSSVGEKHPSIDSEKWNGKSIPTLEKAAEMVDQTREESKNKAASVDYSLAGVEEPVQEEHKVGVVPSTDEQTENQSGFEMGEIGIISIPVLENFENASDSKGTVMDNMKEKPIKSIASGEGEAMGSEKKQECAEQKMVMEQEGISAMDKDVEERRLKEDLAGITSVQEPPRSTEPKMIKEPTELEIGIESVSLRAEHRSLPDEKGYEGSVQIMPEMAEVLEGTREKGEEVKGQSVHVDTEVNINQGEPTTDEQGGKGKNITIIEEGGLTKEQNKMQDQRKKEKGIGTEAPEMEPADEYNTHPSISRDFTDFKGEGEPSGLSSEYVSAAEDQYVSAVEDQSSDVGETDSRSSLEHTFDRRLGHEVLGSNREAAPPSYDEELYDEQKIREEISAIRMIVGYKVVMCSSLVDELKALYLFTGLEPPISFTDTSDLAEVIIKLKFLKSVIGVI